MSLKQTIRPWLNRWGVDLVAHHPSVGRAALHWAKPPVDPAAPPLVAAGKHPVPVHQIYITDDGGRELPPFLRMATATVAPSIPRAEHRIHTRSDLRDWIASEYGLAMQRAFDKLRPYAYQADLARYLLLYRLGGWYFDISIRLMMAFDVPPEVDLVVFAENPAHSGLSYGCNNAIIYARAGSPVLAQTIETCYSNIQREHYGKNPLYPTGPACLGRAVAQHDEDLQIILGVFTDLTPAFERKTKGFVLPDGQLFALYKPNNGAGRLSDVGVVGSNDYPGFFARRQIYDRSIELPDWPGLPPVPAPHVADRTPA